MRLPRMTIDLVPLTVGEVLTIHVALNLFAMDLRTDGLGDDEHGKAMVAAYLHHIEHLQGFICASEVKQ